MPKKKKLVKKSRKRRVTIGTRTNRNSKKLSLRKVPIKKKKRVTKRRVFGKKTQSRRQRATKKRLRRYRRKYQIGGAGLLHIEVFPEATFQPLLPISIVEPFEFGQTGLVINNTHVPPDFSGDYGNPSFDNIYKFDGLMHVWQKFYLPLTNASIDPYNCISSDNEHDEIAVKNKKKRSAIEDWMLTANYITNNIKQNTTVLKRGTSGDGFTSDSFVHSVFNQRMPNNEAIRAIYIKDVCTSKDLNRNKVAAVLPGLNCMIDQADQSLTSYTDNLTGLPASQPAVVRYLLEHEDGGSGFLYKNNLRFDPTLLKSNTSNNNNRIAHHFSALFNCDVLIYYEIINTIMEKAGVSEEVNDIATNINNFVNDIATNINNFVFEGAVHGTPPVPLAVNQTFDDFKVALRPFLSVSREQSERIIKRMNLVGFNFLWQKLMALCHISCVLDSYYRDIVDYHIGIINNN